MSAIAESLARTSGARPAALAGCTVATTASFAQASTLADSFLRWHPNSSFTILLLDAFDLPQRAGVWSLDDLGLPGEAAHRWPIIYRPAELSLAVRPLLLQRLLRTGAKCSVYLSADIHVFASLGSAQSLAQTHGAVLVSRLGSQIDPEALANASERLQNEPGFVAVAGRSQPFLQWWSARVFDDANAGRSLDRGVLDKVPGDSDAKVLDEPAWNLGYWNLPGRKLTAVDDHYEVDGEPVRLFNFSGYEIDKPHLLSEHQGHQPRVLLSEQPALAKLCREYRDKVLAAAAEQAQRHPQGIGYLPSGLKVDRHTHRLYQQAVARFESNAGPRPPDPMSPHGEIAFIKWLNQRMMDGKPEITRYMLAIHSSRPDLQQAFAEPLGADAGGFHAWFLTCGKTEENVPPQLMPSDTPIPASLVSDDPRTKPNDDDAAVVEIVGYFRAELGNGETARLLVSAFDAAGIPFMTKVYDRTSSRQSHPFDQRSAAVHPDIQLICINADQLPAFAATRNEGSNQPRYKIGLWFWEVDEFPSRFDRAFDLVDEVWVTSEFVGNAIRRVSPKPVVKIELPMLKPSVSAELSRSSFGLPERYCFLFNFDFLSVLERKNAVGLITAFTRAFRAGEGPILVIKSINGDQRVLESERLKFAAAEHPDIRLMDGYLSAIEKNSLTAASDCYVSLHRSEGFGQTIAEAMALGKPAIATAYSGNLEFMTPENSYLCPYAEREVGPECAPYPASAHWAEPDLDAAAALMRHVFENQDEARARGLRASEDIARRHSPAVAGRTIRDRLAVIRRHRARRLETLSQPTEFHQESPPAAAPQQQLASDAA